MTLPRGLGRLKTGTMNNTEREFSHELERRQQEGDILWWRFEGLKFRLADNTFYTPDFVAMRRDRQMVVYEVKGFWEDDARVKIKVAAHQYPFLFIGAKKRAKKNGGGWEYEDF